MGCEELRSRYPHWHVDERIAVAGWWGKPYESLEAATVRAQQVTRWMVQELVPIAGIHLFIVHADFKRLLIAALLGERAANVMPIIGPLHNVGITRFEWNGWEWQLNCLNATSHLPADYIT
jgi:broad specificity phosphatase PhoE